MTIHNVVLVVFTITILCTFNLATCPAANTSPDSQDVVGDYMFCADGVVASNAVPIDGVDVSLHIEGSSGDSERPHQTTNAQGEYSFGLCCSGKDTPYSLTFVKSGFKTLKYNGTSDCSAVQKIELVPEDDKQPNNSMQRTLVRASSLGAHFGPLISTVRRFLH